MIGDDDDMDEIPDTVKMMNFIILLPIKNEDGERYYLKIAKAQQLIPFLAAMELGATITTEALIESSDTPRKKAFKREDVSKDKLLTEKETQLDKDYQERRRLLESEFKEKDQELSNKIKDLERREVELQKAQVEWTKREREAVEAIEYIKKEKAMLDEDAKVAKLQYEQVVEAFDKKKSFIEENKAAIKEQLINLKKLRDDDLAVLKSKEKEVNDAAKQLQKDQAKFEKMKDNSGKKLIELQEKERTLDQLQKELKSKESDLSKRENALAKDKEALANFEKQKKEIPVLHKRHKELMKLVDDLEGNIIGVNLENLEEERHLKDKESELKQLSQGLKDKAARLTKKEKQLRKAEKVLEKEEERFIGKAQPALRAALDMEPMPSMEEYEEDQQPLARGIYGVLEDAKLALASGEIDHSIRLVAEAEVLLEKLSDEERANIKYDVRELKTSIKLASLN